MLDWRWTSYRRAVDIITLILDELRKLSFINTTPYYEKTMILDIDERIKSIINSVNKKYNRDHQ